MLKSSKFKDVTNGPTDRRTINLSHCNGHCGNAVNVVLSRVLVSKRECGISQINKYMKIQIRVTRGSESVLQSRKRKANFACLFSMSSSDVGRFKQCCDAFILIKYYYSETIRPFFRNNSDRIKALKISSPAVQTASL